MADDASPKSRRERSTRYPGVPLDDCVELCRFIASKGLDGLTAPDIATSLGYKNIKTNTFSARLSSTRQFGLLVLTGDGYALTPLAKSILHPVNPSEVADLHRQALREPPIYADLIDRLEGKRVPDAAILGNILYHNHHIIATAKDAAAQAFIDSARFAGALDDDMILKARSKSAAPSAPGPPTPEPAPVVESAVEPARRTEPSAPTAPAVRIDLRLWGRDEGKVVRVRGPESITAESYERLIQALKLHLRIDED